jgi:hypothetical protein
MSHGPDDEAARTSETSITFYQTTRRNNSEDSHVHTRHCKHLKSRRLKIPANNRSKLQLQGEGKD